LKYYEGVVNLGLGTRAGIGEWKSDVSGHRDVTFKLAREDLEEGKQKVCREKFTVQFLFNSRENISTTKLKLQMLSYKVFITQL